MKKPAIHSRLTRNIGTNDGPVNTNPNLKTIQTIDVGSENDTDNVDNIENSVSCFFYYSNIKRINYLSHVLYFTSEFIIFLICFNFQGKEGQEEEYSQKLQEQKRLREQMLAKKEARRKAAAASIKPSFDDGSSDNFSNFGHEGSFNNRGLGNKGIRQRVPGPNQNQGLFRGRGNPRFRGQMRGPAPIRQNYNPGSGAGGLPPTNVPPPPIMSAPPPVFSAPPPSLPQVNLSSPPPALYSRPQESTSRQYFSPPSIPLPNPHVPPPNVPPPSVIHNQPPPMHPGIDKRQPAYQQPPMQTKYQAPPPVVPAAAPPPIHVPPPQTQYYDSSYNQTAVPPTSSHVDYSSSWGTSTSSDQVTEQYDYNNYDYNNSGYVGQEDYYQSANTETNNDQFDYNSSLYANTDVSHDYSDYYSQQDPSYSHSAYSSQNQVLRVPSTLGGTRKIIKSQTRIATTGQLSDSAEQWPIPTVPLQGPASTTTSNKKFFRRIITRNKKGELYSIRKIPVDAKGNEIGEPIIEYQQDPKNPTKSVKVSKSVFQKYF